MDYRHNVNDTDDVERHPPPHNQPQHRSTEPNQIFDDNNVLGDDLFGEENDYYGNDGLFGLSNIDGFARHAPQSQLNTCPMPGAEEVASGPNVDDAGAVSSGYHDSRGHFTAVNGHQGLDFLHILSHVGVPGSTQTIANTSCDPVDLHRHISRPQFGSDYLNDHSFFGYTNDSYNDQFPAAYTAPPPDHTSTLFMESTADDDKAQLAKQAISPALGLPKRSRRRRRGSFDSTEAPEASRTKKQCAGCGKAFYTSKDPDKLRCSRCHDKHVKHTAGHTTYVFDPGMTIDHAWRRLYPHNEPLAPAGDDVEAARAKEQDYLRRLIEAVSLPYTSDGSNSKEDQQRVAQQSKLNKKPFDSTQYRDDLVNARIRFLFHTALSYHGGGPSLYDTGGDNSGYGEDRTMKFSDRMERITQLLTLDKDIAMDVIEGRGVTALVHNPNKYERRKRDNKKSNDTKQDLQEKGKQLDMLKGGASASPAPIQEPTLGQRMSLHNLGDSLNTFDATAPPRASLSGLGMLGQGNEPRFGEEGGNEVAGADFDEFEGYAPASF